MTNTEMHRERILAMMPEGTACYTLRPKRGVRVEVHVPFEGDIVALRYTAQDEEHAFWLAWQRIRHDATSGRPFRHDRLGWLSLESLEYGCRRVQLQRAEPDDEEREATGQGFCVPAVMSIPGWG